MNQEELRKNIKNIQNDSTLTLEEKTTKIKELMSSPTIISHGNNSGIKDFSDKLCIHYNKKCDKFYFSCCNSYYNCIRCHNENIRDKDMHEPQLETIKCNECNSRQEPNKSCNNCGLLFSRSYCKRCNIWTSKNITHCDLCGLCRVGLKENLYHCNKCEACFVLNELKHHCVQVSFKNQICIFCLENVHSSTKKCIATRCGHIVHKDCFEDGFKNNIFKCSLCRKSLFNMTLYWKQIRNEIKNQPMPQDFFKFGEGDIILTKYGKCLVILIENNKVYGELVDWILKNRKSAKIVLDADSVEHLVQIYCNDCETTSNAKFHFIGMECLYCHGYNTTKNDI